MSENSTSQLDAALGYLIVRATLGLNISIHGLSRIIAGPTSFAHSLTTMFEHTFLPASLVYLFGLCLPWAEAIVGGLVFVGLCTRYALVGGAFLILNLTFGATLRQDWESAGLQLVYVAIYAALLAFRRYNAFSVDGYFTRKDPD